MRPVIPRWKGISRGMQWYMYPCQKTNRIHQKMQKIDNHGFGGKNGHTNFKQSYLGLQVTKSGRDSSMEIWKREEQDGMVNVGSLK
jgi:hypothetical protein